MNQNAIELMQLLLNFAVVGIAILLSKKSGPFDIFSKARDFLYSNKYIGVFAFKMINCMYCFSFWIGLILSLILGYAIFNAILFAFSCAFVGYCVGSATT